MASDPITPIYIFILKNTGGVAMPTHKYEQTGTHPHLSSRGTVIQSLGLSIVRINELARYAKHMFGTKYKYRPIIRGVLPF